MNEVFGLDWTLGNDGGSIGNGTMEWLIVSGFENCKRLLR